MKRRVFPFLFIGLIGLGIVACNGSQSPAKQANEKGEVKPGKVEKPEVTYYPNGSLKTTGKYKNGERDGLWSSWFETGELRSEAYYQNGLRNGEYKVWYANEQAQIEGFFTDDKPSGIWHLYDSLGVLVNKIEYKNGEPVKLPLE